MWPVQPSEPIGWCLWSESLRADTRKITRAPEAPSKIQPFCCIGYLVRSIRLYVRMYKPIRMVGNRVVKLFRTMVYDEPNCNAAVASTATVRTCWPLSLLLLMLLPLWPPVLFLLSLLLLADCRQCLCISCRLNDFENSGTTGQRCTHTQKRTRA